jgi:hypothetical protein
MAGMRDHFHFHHDIVANASRLVHHLHKRCLACACTAFELCRLQNHMKTWKHEGQQTCSCSAKRVRLQLPGQLALHASGTGMALRGSTACTTGWTTSRRSSRTTS